MEPGFKALGSEDDVIVLEIGSFYTKCGIGKETFPRAIFKNPPGLLSLNHSSTCDEFYEVLRDFLNLIYFHKVQVNPKESVTVLSESLMAPRGKIEAIVKILFEDLQVLGVCLVLEESLPLYTTGMYTGLMVDAGYSKTRILPVWVMQIFEGIPIVLAYQDLDVGAKSLFTLTENTLKEKNPGKFSQETLEDINVSTTQARLSMMSYGRLRQDLLKSPSENKLYTFYPLGHPSKVTMSLRQRFLPDELFFGDSESDSTNLASSLLKSLLKCDLDTRKALIGKIIVSGGSSMIPGFIERLEEELLEQIESPEFIKLKPLKKYICIKDSLFPRNVLTWIGASIASNLQGAEKFMITSQKYLEKGLSDTFGTLYLFANRPPMHEIYKPAMPEKKRMSILMP